jgi:hypothetical protein
VHDSLVVRVAEGVGDLSSKSQRILNRQLAFFDQPLAKRFTIDVGHGVPQLAGGFARVVDGEYVRMLQAGGESDLSLKPLRSQSSSQFQMKHLESDRSIVSQILGQVDRGHAAAPERTLDAVTIGKLCAKLICSA